MKSQNMYHLKDNKSNLVPVLIRKLVKRPIIRQEKEEEGFLKSEPWSLPLLILSSLHSSLLLLTEFYLLTQRQTSKGSSLSSSYSSRTFFLSNQILLLGLLFSSLTALSFSFSPSSFLCGVLRFGTGVSYALIYGSLLLSLLHNYFQENTARDVSFVPLPRLIQILLLVLAIGVQIVIEIQWLLQSPPESSLRNECNISFFHYVFSLLYIFALLTALFILSFKIRIWGKGSKRKTTLIRLTLSFHMCIFVIWILGGFLGGRHFEDLCTAGGLISVSLITFVTMFLSNFDWGRNQPFKDEFGSEVDEESSNGENGRSCCCSSTSSASSKSEIKWKESTTYPLSFPDNTRAKGRERLQIPLSQKKPVTSIDFSLRDLHSANELRASRKDLQELREILRSPKRRDENKSPFPLFPSKTNKLRSTISSQNLGHSQPLGCLYHGRLRTTALDY